MTLVAWTREARGLACRLAHRGFGTPRTRVGGRGGSPDCLHLRHALSCRLTDVGDAYDRGDVEAARRALDMATAIEAELSFGAVLEPIGCDRAHPASAADP
jgi:hypothetical protein